MSQTYYQILGCSENASLEEIKQRYRRLAKDYHPDKGKCLVDSDDKFVKIDEAWKALREVESRRRYDSFLTQKRSDQNDAIIYAELSLNELNFVDGVFRYPCRCGGFFDVDQSILNASCLIECDECSYVICIKV